MKNIQIYTDGSSRGNPGPGGYGVILETEGYSKEISEGFKKTTNNRMELMAVIVGLESLKVKPLNVMIYSDSKYVIDAVEKKWVFKWEKTNFNNKKNPDLWKRFLKIFRCHNVIFIWIKGHNNHQQNERCDFLAVKAALGKELIEDEFYENL